MRSLHDRTFRSDLERRLSNLPHDAQRKWGKMSVDQMLWHVNLALDTALGRVSFPPERPPIPRALLKFIVMNLPWPKGAPTMAAFVAKERYDFETERARSLKLIEVFAAKPLEDSWPPSPVLGRMSGNDTSRLHAKHLDHHLRQFGV